MPNYIYAMMPTAAVAMFVAAPLALAAEIVRPGFVDPLDAPAVAVNAAFQKPMMGATHAGARLVAVGMHGVIVYSDDAGRSWRQAASPVQSDLTALAFSGARRGWAVGHSGVILATSDGGANWHRQFDGRMAAAQFIAHYQAQVDSGHAGLQPLLQEMTRNFQNGPSLPFLDIVADDDQRAFAVGPFGMVAATEDGGQTWTPWLERVDNPELLSFYAARKIGSEIYLTGERGMVYKLNRIKNRFERLPTGYAGSLFGIVGNDRTLIAYGLRGTVTVSADNGKHWRIAALAVPAAVVGADALADGRFVFASINGSLWLGEPDGSSFSPFSTYGAPASSLVSVSSNKVLVGGLRGVAFQEIPSSMYR